MHLKMSSAKCRLFCLGLNVLISNKMTCGNECADVETKMGAQCQTCMMQMFPNHLGHRGDRMRAPQVRADKVSGIYIAVETRTGECWIVQCGLMKCQTVQTNYFPNGMILKTITTPYTTAFERIKH